MSARRFELSEGTSDKFWEIELEGNSHTVRFGRIGTDGQVRTKEFDTPALAEASCNKLIAQKVKKGYGEVGGAPAPTTGSKKATSSKKKGASKKRTQAQEAKKGSKKSSGKKTAANTKGDDAVAPQPTEKKVDPVLEVQEQIDLEPMDHSWPSWVDPAEVQLPEPPAFDRDRCIAEFRRLSRSQYVLSWDFEALVGRRMSRQEAGFWTIAIGEAGRMWTRSSAFRKEKKEKLLAKLKKTDFELEPTEDLLRVYLEGSNSPALLDVLAWRLPPERYWDSAWRMEEAHAAGRAVRHSVLPRVLRQVLRPAATKKLLAQMKKVVKADLAGISIPTQGQITIESPSPYLAGWLGLGKELRKFLASYPDGVGKIWDYVSYYQQPQLMVLGLDSPELIESEMRRLELPLDRPELVRGWLATTGTAALDLVADSIALETSKPECEALLREFVRVKSPAAAPHMLRLLDDAVAPALAREWFEIQVGSAISGLLPLVSGRGRQQEQAVKWLLRYRQRGHGALIAKLAKKLSKEEKAAVKKHVLDAELIELTPLSDSKPPAWMKEPLASAFQLKTNPKASIGSLDELPQIAFDKNRTLSLDQLDALERALHVSELDAPHPLVAAVREHATPSSRHEFVWALFDLWMECGAPSQAKWAMKASGLLGTDATALALTPLIRVWPGESQHPRAVLGLECLRTIGSDVALMQLSGIANKLKFKGLKKRAGELMEDIAKDLGLTRPELEDRIVPDCGLDERGTRELDFGPRKFFFALGGDRKPVVRDEDGKLRKDLPKPAKSDDREKATAAVEEWKLLKKQVREALKIQIVRLEQGMVTGRRWQPADFELFLARHPLMTHLARLVVWGAFDDDGKRIRSFRITEEQDYADQSDEPCTLDDVASIAILHPLHMDEAERAAWGEVQSDYEIVPPFPQLGRETYSLEKGDAKKDAIEHFSDFKLPATSLVGTLERQGWTRGIPQDAGIFFEHSKPFYGANVTAVVQYDGVPVGYMDGWDDQHLSACFFVPGIYTAEMYPSHKKRVKLGKIDEVVISEVLSDLHLLRSKGN